MRALVARAVLVPTLVGALVASVLLVSAPAQAQKIRPNFWGMHDNDWTSSPTVKVGAANFTTSGTYWHQVETSPGDFDWTRLDTQVSYARTARARPVLILGGTPTFHAAVRRGKDKADPPRMRPWKRYVRKVANRYGNKVDYQIWPEPNIIENWTGSMRQLAKVTVSASRVIHKAVPKATVVGGAMTLRKSYQRDRLRSFYKQKVLGTRVHRTLDAIAIDPFPEMRGTPEDSLRLMKQARGILRSIGVRKPLWNNEINYGVAGGGDTSTVKFGWAKQRSYVIRTYLLSAAAGMKRTYWLAWFRSSQLGVHMTHDGGGLDPAPPSRSYSVVRQWIGGSRFKGCDRKRNGVWVCTARKAGEVRRVYWDPKGRTRVTLPRSRKRLETQTGHVNTTPKRRVRVTFRPIMVASRR